MQLVPVLSGSPTPDRYRVRLHLQWVTDHQIREAAENGCASLSELTMRTGCGSNCGSCLEMAGDLLNQVHPTRALPLPLLGLASAA